MTRFPSKDCRPPAARILAVTLAAILATTPLLGGAAPHGQSASGPPLQGPAATPASGWAWPLAPRPVLLRAFDPPARPWLSGHRGVDLAAAPEQELLAPDDATVAFAGWVVDRPVLTIMHPDGHRSSFEPVATDLAVGTRVTRGQAIGRVAAAPRHCAVGCIHWSVRRDDSYLDPLRFVADTRPSVLLPWTGTPPPWTGRSPPA
ncbi:peptidoglycan DD-metalloendopeptidase family protein [Sinomonas sp. ASV322]|uniref:M23 family metallopeptidase n=1 Tax=Sinomonas sp. ASV322 TaxID=3041920 RepID=UPI0027DE8903|nr:peptidoglycan DD-metalloendopeptidase family protein [Sinomonas sp. ASV322]MDQ4502769.1 peptidoglycan DD-metalloendopeptidase family protein [Sinomonas sp. ASV322]